MVRFTTGWATLEKTGAFTMNPFTKNFQDIEDFFEDVQNGDLGDYNFIEPRYDTGNNYLDGNSMHPLNDIRKGEELVKRIYESLRNSKYWADTMFIITFDEHGGFYDHQSPSATVSTGDDDTYANFSAAFQFNQLGIRVPAIVISAYTAKGTIIGDNAADQSTMFDHSSVLATVEKRFGLKPLTKRDAAANTLDLALNATAPRLSPSDALIKLTDIAADNAVTKAVAPGDIFAADPLAPLSANQKTMTALALACEMKITDPAYQSALISNHQKIVEQKDAAAYVQNVEEKIKSRRKINPVK
jgi:phospholipase C